MKTCSYCGRQSPDTTMVCCGVSLVSLEFDKPDQPADPVAATIAERGKVYGDPYLSHVNIGLSWTALISHHYGITLDHPIPASLTARLLIALKNQRASLVYHEDNYVDMEAYRRFAQEFQQIEDAHNDIVNSTKP